MRIKSQKLISLFLSILMILSIVPTTVFADTWVNVGGYGATNTGGNGKIQKEFENKLVSMNGYKVSMWYCPVTEYRKDEKGEKYPYFDWSASNSAIIQAGKTMYYRRDPIMTTDGKYVLPNVFNLHNIYQQTTLGYEWLDGKTKTDECGHFPCHITNDVLEKANSDANYKNDLENQLRFLHITALGSIWSYIPFGKDRSDWNPAEVGLVDWVQRLYNMESPSSVSLDDLSKLNMETYTSSKYSTFGIHDAESYQLGFPDAMAKGSDKNHKKSIEYLKSYFLSPAFLNEYFFISRSNQDTLESDIYVRNFLDGSYRNLTTGVSYEKGQYKIYIEPVLFRAYNNTDGLMCMSWRDVMLEHQYKIATRGVNGFCSMNTLLPQLSNSFTLTKRDESLMYNGTYLGEKSGSFIKTGQLETGGIIPTAKDNLNTLGVAVVTSPSLNAYIDKVTPEVIKTYSILTGITNDGRLKFEKFSDSVKNDLSFYKFSGGDYSLYPMIEEQESISGGTAFLNDMITTNREIGINSDTEWTSDLPQGITGGSADSGELVATSQDIVGYSFGRITASDVFIDSYIETYVDYYAKYGDFISDRAELMSQYNNTITKAQRNLSEIGTFDSTYGQSTVVFTEAEFTTATNEELRTKAVKSAEELSIEDSASSLIASYGEGVQNAVKFSLKRFDSATQYNCFLTSDSQEFKSSDEVPFIMTKDSFETEEKYLFYNQKSTDIKPLTVGFLLEDKNGIKIPSKLTEKMKKELSEQYLGATSIPEDKAAAMVAPDVGNTLILRYIVIPNAQQVDLIDLYKDGVKVGSIVGEKQNLQLNGNTVTIQKPKATLNGTPKLVEYVSNIDYPMKDVSDGNLPSKSVDGVEGTIDGTIADYPIEPMTHNLYVRWKVEIDTEGDDGGDVVESVPEWRLSKYFGTNVIENGYTYMTLPITYGCCGYAKLDGSYGLVSRPYQVINANNKVNDGSYSPNNMKYKSWLHSATENTGDNDRVGVDKRTSTIMVDGIINAVKSTETSGLKAVNWIQGEWTNNGYLKDGYDISSASTSNQFNGAEHQKYVLSDTLKLNTLNTKSYSNTWPYYRSRKRGHGHRWTGSKTISTTSPSYIPYYLDTEIIFERYNQVNTDSRLLTVPSKTEVENAYTTLVYQPGDIMKVYPEYGMLFTSDSNDGDTNASRSSIKWMVGDQARSIKPAIYQTLRFKVFVQPNSTGSSVATDSRALTARNKISDATAKNKQIVYKGSSVNTAFQLYRDSSRNNAALLTLKTFALDYNDSIKTSDNKTVQNAWGMDGYKPENYHTNLMNNLNKKATAYEKLYIKEDGATYNGGVKQQQTNNFELSGSNYTTFNHELIIRGGKLIGVRVQDRNDKYYIPMTMEQLKANNSYADLYDAIIETKLYNESNDKNATVLSTFEHQTGNALSEQLYADKLEQARQLKDGLPSATPNSSKVVVNSGWYSEDTTVLVMKEFVTNYKVPSISFSDKLSLQITGLNTPMDKSLFFNKVARGHVYLKYDLGLKTAMGENTNVYFEYNSNNDYKISNKVYIADTERKLGYIGTDYLVPNVSITDTTRQ